MSTNTWWLLVGIVLVAGIAAGCWLTLRVMRSRFDAQLQRVTDEMQQRHASLADQLRTAQTRSQAELEQSRSSFKRQLAVMAAEPRAALERAEDRLRMAYAELDRLRGKGTADTSPSDLSDGFAATRPMREGM